MTQYCSCSFVSYLSALCMRNIVQISVDFTKVNTKINYQTV